MSGEREEQVFVREITKPEEDFSQWYTDVVLKSELVDYAPVRGCMVIRPYGYALWENIQRRLDDRIKATGHQNAYFPLFIPESFLRKEAEHVKGFAPEVAWVTHGGDEQLGERLAIRPTSETIICTMYARWVNSWRDLPVLINQWCNIVRWEKATKPFLRTAEFLWQEGHTAHASAEEAEEETLRMLEVYRDFIENDLAIPVVTGRKSEREKFAGAVHTYTLESLMQDGRVLQMGTSHNLGQHFARVFDIKFLDKQNELKYVYQTSWGVTTRLIGGIVMTHGDERGLRLPPRVAPVQVVIIPIITQEEREKVLSRARELEQLLRPSFRVHLDDREEHSPGWKFNEWELRGVPVRLEIGPRDIRAGQVVLARRDRADGRTTVPEAALPAALEALLDEIQANMFASASDFLRSHTSEAADREEFLETLGSRTGLVRARWCGQNNCEAEVKEKTGATIRCIPFGQDRVDGHCVHCGSPARHLVYYGRAY